MLDKVHTFSSYHLVQACEKFHGIRDRRQSKKPDAKLKYVAVLLASKAARFVVVFFGSCELSGQKNEKFGKMGGKLLVDVCTFWCQLRFFLVSFFRGAAWTKTFFLR